MFNVLVDSVVSSYWPIQHIFIQTIKLSVSKHPHTCFSIANCYFFYCIIFYCWNSSRKFSRVALPTIIVDGSPTCCIKLYHVWRAPSQFGEEGYCEWMESLFLAYADSFKTEAIVIYCYTSCIPAILQFTRKWEACTSTTTIYWHSIHTVIIHSIPCLSKDLMNGSSLKAIQTFLKLCIKIPHVQLSFKILDHSKKQQSSVDAPQMLYCFSKTWSAEVIQSQNGQRSRASICHLLGSQSPFWCATG